MEDIYETQPSSIDHQLLKNGTVYWITGLSASGKTTIGKLFYNQLLKSKQNLVFLDGDVMREIFGNGLGHSLEDRKKLAMSYSRLCKALAEQGLDVVCATISMFHECHKWNRENISNYKEIYLQTPMGILIKRDTKGLYSKSLESKKNNVVGVDQTFEEPLQPDIVIENDGSQTPSFIVKQLLNRLLD